MNNKSRIWSRIATLVFAMVMVISFVIPQHVDAAGARGSSSATSSSSAASSASRSASTSVSSSSSSSMSRQSAINASRQSSINASKNATMRANQNSTISRSQAKSQAKNYQKGTVPKGNKGTISRTQAKYQSMQNKTRPMTPPTKPMTKGSSYERQYMNTSFYNNWLFYYMVLNANQSQKEQKLMSVENQKKMLKQQMKPNEKTYSVTVKTDKGSRVITLPKKDYDKVQKGAKIEYSNGQLKIA